VCRDRLRIGVAADRGPAVDLTHAGRTAGAIPSGPPTRGLRRVLKRRKSSFLSYSYAQALIEAVSRETVGESMIAKLTRPRAVLEDVFKRTIATGSELSGRASNMVPEEPFVRPLFIDFKAWDNNVRMLLEGAFTDPGPASAYPAVFSEAEFLTPTWEGDLENVHRGLSLRITALRIISDTLGLYEEPSEAIRVGQEHPASHSSNTIFIVHGRSEGPKYRVARFLESVTDATPIILHEQAKRGRVVIETLEEYAATAAFAIVLLTADDYGGLVQAEDRHPRARQNVVFELGFFIGALGRSRVAVLYEDGVELPSDMNGILYSVLDSQGAWKLDLGKELRAAGFVVDLNRAQ
jgi:predicted nucleotide-binding protein